jgi:hypothetical protein
MTLAYLDPGSGSLIASALVGGVAAAGVAAKQARYRLTSGFGRKRKQQVDQETEVDTEVDDDAEAEATTAADAAPEGEPADAGVATKATTVGTDT